VAHAARLARPTVDDWAEVNRTTPRLVSVLPNGPVDHPTVRVFLAGGVPEVMLHLRELGLIDSTALTALGEPLDAVLDAWRTAPRRRRLRELLHERDGVDPDEVIYSPARAQQQGLAGTLAFLTGNLAPDGAVVKATAVDRALFVDGQYRHTGPARVFTSERAAMAAIKGATEKTIAPGDVIVLAGCGPAGTGMEETYQLTSALKYLPWGKQVALVTDARFSGVSTGACIGHVGPEALAGGPIGKVQDGDVIEIVICPKEAGGTLNLVGIAQHNHGAAWGATELASRALRADLAEATGLPDDTRLWALLQNASGGTWGGCVYDYEAIRAQLTPQG
jgi:xylonate dehydratase